MSEVEGKLVTCDVCGSEAFVRFTGTKEADGGYGKWRGYEPLPNGWNAVHVNGMRSVCPTCSVRIKRAIDTEIEAIRKEKDVG